MQKTYRKNILVLIAVFYKAIYIIRVHFFTTIAQLTQYQ